jgi:outer membrane receptor for ferrienterochelin and colicin
MTRRRLRYLSLLLASGAVLSAQTTGGIQGHVVDSRGKLLPGVRVVVTGPGMQGGRTAVTDEGGAYRIGLLPPGLVTVTATKEGFNAAKAQVQVGLDKTATVELKVTPLASATVEVFDANAEVDMRATTAGGNFTSDQIDKLPVSRDFANIALLAPGVSQDREGFKVYGATGSDNNYLVDGINTTGVEFGTQGKKIPMEFVKEFQVKTGGYEAEYGKATGGVINVITKSGGNEFTGDLFSYAEGYTLRTHNQHQNEGVRAVPLEDKRFESGFDVGGYLVKDKLWFFAAYDRSKESTINQIQSGAAGQTAPTDSNRDLFALKLTWRINEGQTLIASVLGDPQKVTGAVKNAVGPSSTWDGISKVGGTDYSLRYEITGSSWFAQIQVSRHNETNSTLPGSGGGGIQYQDNTATGDKALFPTSTGNGVNFGGFGRYDAKDFTRDTINGTFTKFLGSHELKAGFDLQSDSADRRSGFTGGSSVTIFDNPAGATPNPYIFSHYYWTTGDAAVNLANPAASNIPSIEFTAKPKHQSQAYFVQDKWSLAPRWTLNVGVRLDQTDIKDQFGASVIKLKDQWSPRLGLIWDFKGKGQDKLYMSMSRYYEQVPLDLVIRSFSIERNPTIINYSPTSLVINPAAEADFSFDTTLRIVGTTAEPVDTDLKGSYSDEFILGAETTVDNLYTLSAKYIRRYLGRAIEDGLDQVQGNYFIMNPGQSHDAGVRFPKAVRDYNGVELSAERKLANHYSWQVNYLWSRLIGNYEGTFQGIGGADGTGQLDPNINSAFDLPEFIVNSYGHLSGDRTHQFKANGAYEFDSGLNLGATFQYLSGTPISKLGYHDGYGRYELFIDPRGTAGRTPDTTRLDLNVAYSFKLNGTQKLRLMLDITNLLDSQTATVIDQRFNFKQGDPQTNANYLKGFAFQAPRSIRLGLRYSF